MIPLAVFRGTDVFQNIAPDGGAGGFADRYPLSHYGLDYHVDGPSIGLGGVSAGDIPAQIAQFVASVLFSLSAWIMRAILDVFDWAFSLDLINGPRGALGPIGRAAQHLYSDTLGPEFLAAAVSLTGLWAIWKLSQRKYAHLAIGLTMSVLCVAVAVLIILKPTPTIGTASQMSNDLSSSLLSTATLAPSASPGDARQAVKDHLFQTFVYEPWVVLEFGGLAHCVSAQLDKDGFPKPVAPDDPARAVCRDNTEYADAFLSLAPGSDDRNAVYDDLNHGQGQFDKADSPAADMMQAGGAFQRLVVAAIVFGAVLGAALLLGMLCFAALIFQVVALGLLALAPAALLAGMFPGRGHDIFRGWLGKLGVALAVKAVFSLLLAVLVAVSLALTAAAATTGFLLAFGLQAAFFWTVFLKRKALAATVMQRRDMRTIERTTERGGQAAAAGAGAVGGAVAHPIETFGGLRRQENVTERKRHEEREKTTTSGDHDSRAPADAQPSGRVQPVPEPSPAPAPQGAGNTPPGPRLPDSEPERASLAAAIERARGRRNGHSTQEDTMPVTAPVNGKPVPVQDFAAAMRAARAEEGQAPRPAREQGAPTPKVERNP